MITFPKMTCWSTGPLAWPAFFGSLIVAAAAWLSAGRTGSDANDSVVPAQRPSAAPLHAESEQGSPCPERHPLDEALEFVQPSLQALKSVKDYTAVFTKTELVHGRLLTQTLDMKFREGPFSVYLRGHSKGAAGREVIFVAGRNDGNLFVHESGLKALLGTLTLKPEVAMSMDANRHAITDIGIAKMLDMAIEIWKHERHVVDASDVDVRITRNVDFRGRKCDVVETSIRRQQPGLAYQSGRVSIDCQSRLPVQAELFGWPANPGDEVPLLERYTYSDIQTNVGLSDTDFDPRNPAYHFGMN